MIEMNLDGRTDARQRRWRRLGRILSGSLAAVAIGGAVYLGATGPLVSPVQPPEVAAAVAPAPAPTADGDPFVPNAGDRTGGRRADRRTGFDRGRDR